MQPQVPQTPVHELEAEVRSLHQHGLRTIAGAALTKIFSGIKNRRNWIAIRTAQIEKLQELRVILLQAYDAGDEDKINFVHSEINKIEQAGCKEPK